MVSSLQTRRHRRGWRKRDRESAEADREKDREGAEADREKDRKRDRDQDDGALVELVPLQRVNCNPGCTIPNIGCGIPFTFDDCSAKNLGCTKISVKGNFPYGNGEA